MVNLQISDLQQDIQRAVKFALQEDVGSGDVSAELIPSHQKNRAEVITREDCVLCGRPWFDEVFRQLGGIDSITWQASEGDNISANSTLVTLNGNTRSLLTGERSALNFLQLLCGVASKARQYAQAVAGTKINILDTRKTLPGLRLAQKYAVNIGGCHNHRLGLYDAFLIKENHIAACGGITQAVRLARQNHPNLKVEVEVENLTQLREVLEVGADVVMLDNFSLAETQQAIALAQNNVLLEMSGGIEFADLDALQAVAVDFVSMGELTKSNRAIDLSMRLV